MTTIQGSGGSLYPIEQTAKTPPIVKPQENIPEVGNVVPQINKKESISIPTLTGIEGQLDESFKDFKGSLKDAKERASNISQNSGDEADVMKGMVSNVNIGKTDIKMMSPESMESLQKESLTFKK